MADDDLDFEDDAPEDARAILAARFAEYAKTRDRRQREELISAHLGLARYLAGRFAGRGEPLEDLVQVANLGLLKALERFDPDRGLEFKTFASPTIIGELKRHFRDHGWMMHVPRGTKELHQRLGPAIASLSQTLGRPPRPGEVAESLHVSEEEVLSAMEAGRGYRPVSLDTPVGGDDDAPSLVERTVDLSNDIGRAEDRLALAAALESISPRDREIVYMRFFEDMTQVQIAEQFGISQMQVSRITTKALATLRDKLEDKTP